MYIFNEQTDIFGEFDAVELDFLTVDRKIEHREQLRNKKRIPSRIKTKPPKSIVNPLPKNN
jgi:hypothetical protein